MYITTGGLAHIQVRVTPQYRIVLHLLRSYSFQFPYT